MSAQSFKLLMYFIMTVGFIITGVLIVSFVEIQKSNDKLDKGNANLEFAIVEINKTQASINQTQLFLSQQKHEDEARDIQSKLETMGRSNQTKFIVSNTNDILENFIERYNNKTQILFNNISQLLKDINNAQQQNQDIIDLLLNSSKNQSIIQKLIESSTNDTNTQVSRWGPENNALAKAILQEMGINATAIIQRDVYGNKTLKDMIQ